MMHVGRAENRIWQREVFEQRRSCKIASSDPMDSEARMALSVVQP